MPRRFLDEEEEDDEEDEGDLYEKTYTFICIAIQRKLSMLATIAWCTFETIPICTAVLNLNDKRGFVVLK